MYDVLALYVKEDWLSKETVLDEWGHSLWNSIGLGAHFIITGSADGGGRSRICD